MWFFALNERSDWLLEIRVPKTANDNCMMNNCTSFSRLRLPASTFSASVKLSRHTNGNGIFFMLARLNLDELPGANEFLEKQKKGVEDIENVRNDVSPPNLAILCLPLFRAIPPLSLSGPALDTTIAWYAFAADMLAAIPFYDQGN